MNDFQVYGLLMEKSMEYVGRDNLPKATLILSTPQYSKGQRGDDQPVAVVIYGNNAQAQYEACEEGYSYLVRGWTKSRKWSGRDGNASWITENTVGSIHRCE